MGRFSDDRHQGYGLPYELARRTTLEGIASPTRHIHRYTYFVIPASEHRKKVRKPLEEMSSWNKY